MVTGAKPGMPDTPVRPVPPASIPAARPGVQPGAPRFRPINSGSNGPTSQNTRQSGPVPLMQLRPAFQGDGGSRLPLAPGGVRPEVVGPGTMPPFHPSVRYYLLNSSYTPVAVEAKVLIIIMYII